MENWGQRDFAEYTGSRMIYFILFIRSKKVKIGSTENLQKRLGENYAQFGPFDLLGIMSGEYEDEFRLHENFAHISMGGIFKDRFEPTDELMAFIKLVTEVNCEAQ